MSGAIPDVTSIIGSGLLADRERLSLISSNIANADSITTPSGQPYRAKEPVFEAEPALDGSSVDKVHVTGVVESDAAPKQVYDPGNPYANKDGYITESNVDPVQQMTDLISTTQNYKACIAVLAQSTKLDEAMLQSYIT